MNFSQAKKYIYNLYLIFAVLIASIIVASTARANSACPVNLYNKADSSLVMAREDWNSLFRHYYLYRSCDDGAIAEGYSDAVASLLANRWDRFGDLAHLSEQSPDFRRWVIRHIDSSAAVDDLKRIVQNSTKCPHYPNSKKLCAAIRRVAKIALGDLGAMSR